MPHSETPEWFEYCSGIKRCDIREPGLVARPSIQHPFGFHLLLFCTAPVAIGSWIPAFPAPHGHPAVSFLQIPPASAFSFLLLLSQPAGNTTLPS